MTTAVIVQARLGSTRLPAKVLLPLPNGRTVLEEVLRRCKQIPGIDIVVCAIPDTAENDILSTLLAQMVMYDDGLRTKIPVKTVRGPEHDVLARYAKAAAAVNADVILRITSDCPLLSPEVCGDALRLLHHSHSSYVSNSWPVRHFPHGWDCEVFSRHYLERANAEATSPVDREHVTPYMQRLGGSAVLKSMVDRSSERITLDTLADYVHIWNVMEQQMREAA